MEYDAVQLVNDFITEEKIKKLKADSKEGIANLSKIYEEINLLYVAVTRTKNMVHIPMQLMPVDFPVSPQIHILKVKTDEEKQQEATAALQNNRFKKPAAAILKEKAYSVNKIRENHAGAYNKWTPELDTELTQMYCERNTLKDMAKHFGRTPGAITKRVKKLELLEIYG